MFGLGWQNAVVEPQIGQHGTVSLLTVRAHVVGDFVEKQFSALDVMSDGWRAGEKFICAVAAENHETPIRWDNGHEVEEKRLELRERSILDDQSELGLVEKGDGFMGFVVIINLDMGDVTLDSLLRRTVKGKQPSEKG
jgi:hypothetical protein